MAESARELHIGVLGPMEVLADGVPVPLAAHKERALLALLATRAGEVVSADELIDSLWSGQPPGTAATTLQVYVSRIRKLLEPERAKRAQAQVLVSRAPGYLLALADESTDAGRFEALLADGRAALAAADAARAASLLGEALALWRGPALAEFVYEPWAQREAGRLEELRLIAFEDRIAADLDSGRGAELVSELEQLIADNPLRERLHRYLMLALYRSGRQAEALEAYQRARRALVDDLGIEPGRELQELNRAILNQDEALAAPERVATRPVRIKLPVPPTPLTGRERELAELQQLLEREDVRLLTLTGAGGTGKTRLALQLAADLTGSFPDGVWFVNLAALTDAALVVPTIAETLGVKEQPGRPIVDSLTDHLAAKPALLLLDNFEQVAEAASALAELLAQTTALKLLVTSRVRLHVSAEHQYPVSPLREDEALELFAQRAQAVKPTFAINGNRQLVDEICRRLDRLPLALELAAPRVKALSPAQILKRLEERLPLLTGGARDLPERQRTLRATIEWSYDLLSEQEQQLFRRLSVFAGGCTLEAAEDVADADLDTLQSLVEKSLLRFSAGRYWMLETIREYAGEQLDDAGIVRTLRTAHADFYVQWAEQAEPLLRGPKQSKWLPLVDQDYNNLRAALEWTVDAMPDLALRLGAALRRYWWVRSSLREGRDWIERLLPMARSSSSAPAVRVLVGASALARVRGELDTATAFAEEALNVAVELGDRLLTCMSHHELAIALVAGRFDLPRARHSEEEALRTAREFGETVAVATTLAGLSELTRAEGDNAKARALASEALDVARMVGSTETVGEALMILAALELEKNAGTVQVAPVSAALRESLEIAHELGNEISVCDCLELLAAAEFLAGNSVRAVRLLGAAEGSRERIGAVRDPANANLHERTVFALRDALDVASFVGAFEQGRAVPSEEVVEFALKLSAGEIDSTEEKLESD